MLSFPLFSAPSASCLDSGSPPPQSKQTPHTCLLSSCIAQGGGWAGGRAGSSRSAGEVRPQGVLSEPGTGGEGPEALDPSTSAGSAPTPRPPTPAGPGTRSCTRNAHSCTLSTRSHTLSTNAHSALAPRQPAGRGMLQAHGGSHFSSGGSGVLTGAHGARQLGRCAGQGGSWPVLPGRSCDWGSIYGSGVTPGDMKARGTWGAMSGCSVLQGGPSGL